MTTLESIVEQVNNIRACGMPIIEQLEEVDGDLVGMLVVQQGRHYAHQPFVLRGLSAARPKTCISTLLITLSITQRIVEVN